MNDSGKKVQFTKGNVYKDGDSYKLESNQYDYHFGNGTGWLGAKDGDSAISSLGYSMLTNNEWQYIIDHYSSRNFGFARINHGVDAGRNYEDIYTLGLVILPDNCSWPLPSGCTFNNDCNDYHDNTYSTTQWAAMESIGAVFLPTGSNDSSASADYWAHSSGYSLYFNVATGRINMQLYFSSYGRYVRLVKVVD